MNKLLIILTVLVSFSCANSKKEAKTYQVGQIITTKGEMLFWLYDETPLHKASFIKLANEDYWDSLTFNRVIKNFVIQGGCPDTPEGFSDSPYLIKPEFNDSIKHIYGAVGAGRDNNAEKLSAGCQLYIVHAKDGLHRFDGEYMIFGQVFKGLDVLDSIASVETDSLDVPIDEILLDVNVISLTKEELGEYGYELDKEVIPQKLSDQFNKAKHNFEADPDNPDNIIWYGRRTAYLGRYDDAIKIYSDGIDKFPNNPKLYRHRGHRYISIRKFDNAVQDFEMASRLIQGTENEIEPDGAPNDMNIPISTLHGNIWYHLGLAYYLKHDYEKAYQAYLKCRESGSNDDNIVSSTHWLYMIQKRLGNNELAEQQLEPIHLNATIIENTDYYNLCKFYKGLIPIDSLSTSGMDSPSSDAVKYGIANWYFYNGDKKKSKKYMESIMEGNSTFSFGYIAAESDMKKYFSVRH